MEDKGNEAKKGFIGSLIWLIKKCVLIFIPGIVITITLFMITNAALGPTSTPEFCGELCHQEMGEAYASWQKSTHAHNKNGIQVKCIDCHLPPKDKYFTHLTAKAKTGIKDTYKHLIKKEYIAEDVRKVVREQMTNDVCMRCHWDLKDNKISVFEEIHDMEVFNPEDGKEPAKCIECHDDAGHNRG